VHVLAPVLTVGLAVGAVLAWRQAAGDGTRHRRAQPAYGVVTDVQYNTSLQVFPLVRFATASGQVVQARPASSSNARRFVVGQQVALRYDPQDPSWIVLEGLPSASGTGRAAAVLLGIGASVLALVTVSLLL
jgi:hypothetical protein